MSTPRTTTCWNTSPAPLTGIQYIRVVTVSQPVVGFVARDRGARAAAAYAYADGCVDPYPHAVELYPQIAQIFADFVYF